MSKGTFAFFFIILSIFLFSLSCTSEEDNKNKSKFSETEEEEELREFTEFCKLKYPVVLVLSSFEYVVLKDSTGRIVKFESSDLSASIRNCYNVGDVIGETPSCIVHDRIVEMEKYKNKFNIDKIKNSTVNIESKQVNSK